MAFIYVFILFPNIQLTILWNINELGMIEWSPFAADMTININYMQ